MRLRYKSIIIIISIICLVWWVSDLFSSVGIISMGGMSRNNESNLLVVPVQGRIIFHSDRTDSGLYILQNGRVEQFIEHGGLAKFSPDGKKLLYFKSGGRLAIRNMVTSLDERVLFFPKGYDPISYDWSPDGNKICFTADPIDDRKSFKNLFVYDIYTEEIKQLTFFEGDTPWSVTNPKWSPNGDKILFECHKNIEKGNTGAPISIFIINVDGTGLYELFGDKHWGGGYASWSPDGKKIVFISCANDENKETDIFVYDFEDKVLTRVTKDDWIKRNPVFSPDGKKICYVSPRHGDVLFGSELFVVNIDGTGQARLTAPFKRKDPSPLRKWATDDYPQWSE